jgi:two-component system, cell cycle response regulator DivK
MGVQVALDSRPDVIVMDLSMPRLDGIEAIRLIKHHTRTRHTPVILLTGYPLEAITQGGLEAGASIFLTKPCLPEELERNIRQALVENRRR